MPLGRKWDKRWFAVDRKALMYAESPKSAARRQHFLIRDILEVRRVCVRLAGSRERAAPGSARSCRACMCEAHQVVHSAGVSGSRNTGCYLCMWGETRRNHDESRPRATISVSFPNSVNVGPAPDQSCCL